MAVEAVAGRELHGGDARDGVEGGVDAGRVDLRAARPLKPRCAGELTDHGDRLSSSQRQDRALVAQQHDRFRRRLAREHVVGRRDPVIEIVEFRIVSIMISARSITGGTSGERDHPAHGGIQYRLVELARLHGCDDRLRAVGLRAGHLEIETRCEGRHPGIHGTPVGDDEPLEPPLVAQQLGQQPVVLGGCDPVDAVVGAHHRPRLLRRHHSLEGGQVDLAQRALVDLRTHRHAVGLLVVGSEVLERCAHTGRLDAANPRSAEHPADQRILGEVLEVATAQGRPLDVHARAEKHPDALRACFLAEGAAHALHEVDIPARGDARRRREAGRRCALPDTEVIVATHLPANTVGSVGEHNGSDARLGCLERRPEPATRDQGSLLLEAQRRIHRITSLRGWVRSAVRRSPRTRPRR